MPSDNSRKPASAATIEQNNRFLAELPFSDQRSFEEASRGLLEALPEDCVIAAGEDVSWDYAEVGFAKPGAQTPNTVNPSLWRQAQAMSIAGFFEVIEDAIYQVRGTDLSNITFIEGPDGVVVMDPLTCQEAAAYSRSFIANTAAISRSWPSSTPTRTSTTTPKSGAWSTKPTSRQVA